MRTAFGGVLLIGEAISVIGLIAIAGLSLSVKGGRVALSILAAAKRELVC